MILNIFNCVNFLLKTNTFISIKTFECNGIKLIHVNTIHPTLWNIFHVLIMIHEIVKLQHIDILHIDPPTSDHGQFHSDHV